jgi:hypothetical protein
MRMFLLAFATLSVAGCASTAQQAADGAAVEAKNMAAARQLAEQGRRYCIEAGQQPGTQHRDDCILDYGTRILITRELVQLAAAPPPQAPRPSRPFAVPNVAGQSAGAAFASGFAAGAGAAPSEVTVGMAPQTCMTTGTMTTCN